MFRQVELGAEMQTDFKRHWDKQKDTIQTLFLTEDRPLREVRQTLAEKHGFEASERQYKSQFETWGWRKNIPNVHMARMVKIRDRRRAEGKETCFSVGGFDVDPERIDRYAKRSSQKDESEQADAPPPEIKFRTPLGTPKLGEFQENSASVVRHATSDLDIFDQELFKHKNTIGVQASADVMAEPDAFDSEPAWLCDNSGAPASAPMVKSADLDSEDSSQGTWSSKRRKMNNARTAKSLSCPFRKRNPSRFNIRDHIACANTSFTDLSQVKKHVRIYHAPPKADGVERDDPEDGISREIETVLLSRKSTDGTNPPPDFQPPIEVEEITHSLLTSVKDLKPAIQGVIDDQTPDSDEMTDRGTSTGISIAIPNITEATMSGPAHVGPVPSVVPGSNTVVESAVVRAPLARVWHLIKLQDFAKFWSILKGSEEVVQGAAREAEVFKWTFADGSVYEVKQEEHSSINHFITYSIIGAEPALPYTSVTSTIRLHAVTSGEFADSTFVEWTATFSNDAELAVIQDAKYKRRDALKDLASAATKK
ncbi:hypothetical protein P8C59_000428 [Phyllachora maydis]|uniref:Clr5 domain-containing protein n=1 Tax=Phyllachora maydis TaxID=1825666 RepID=A0AAD9HXL7_9PEZI|nr:hypothetical protein P8C59_000428 [Phyllachora maydis]